MPRTLQYDPQEKLHLAMKLFWRQGYRATGVAQLCQVTGLNRFSLYNVFMDKDTLYVLTLDLYRETVFRRMILPLTLERADLQDIHEYFDSIESSLLSGVAGWGCYLQAAACEGIQDQRAQRSVRQGLDQLVNLFRNALRRSKVSRSLRPDLDIWAAAEYLMVNVQGIFSLGRSGAEEAEIRQFFHILRGVLADWQRHP